MLPTQATNTIVCRMVGHCFFECCLISKDADTSECVLTSMETRLKDNVDDVLHNGLRSDDADSGGNLDRQCILLDSANGQKTKALVESSEEVSTPHTINENSKVDLVLIVAMGIVSGCNRVFNMTEDSGNSSTILEQYIENML